MPLHDSDTTRVLILDILRLSPTLPDSSQLLRMKEPDWDYLIRVAGMHRLGPVLHDCILRKNLLPLTPPRVVKVLQKTTRKHSLRNLALYQELIAVTRLLAASKIPSLALKGAFLANFTYQAIGLRPMRDIDLLVPKTHVVKAFELLKENGYQTGYDGLPEAHLEGKKIHLPPLARPNGIPIELHHRLTFPHPNGVTDEYESAIWTRSISKRMGNTSIKFPCVEDLLLHLCYHATEGHQFSIGPLALMDVALLIQDNQIDWDEIVRMASNGWRHYLLAPLYLAKLHIGADIPEWVMEALDVGRDKTQWLESAEYLLFSELGDHMLLNSSMQKILCSENLHERIWSVTEILFPTRATIATHFPVRPDAFRAFLYYPSHWRRLMKKKLPLLISRLLQQPAEIEKLAAHKQAFSSWLETDTGRTPDQ
ncbi:hypothetical protein Metme_3615 [Methylomonas methanica MC09]|uniref:Uncharacterized protein n=2 Tax=Methylomonas methanica TaxID=421 RepID=F9ZVJ4_METMM|nr:hypothetical protein Metme_3615 [Methylomonas methanica MC09]